MSGAVSHHAGEAAEATVARHYGARGMPVVRQRWRGRGGEVDLIARDGAGLVFIEVKRSRSHAVAATRLGRRQMDRLCAAAAEYIASEPRGQLTDVRFDLALVDGVGRIDIIENAFGEN